MRPGTTTQPSRWPVEQLAAGAAGPDEPSGNLDPANAQNLHELLAAVARNDGRALVVVTHNRALAARADRVLALHDGRLVPPRGDEAMAP